MSAARVVFDVAGALSLVFAGVMVIHRNPIKSLLSIVLSFFSLAVMFVLLAAPFLAVLQIIVYAGAILVLFLFVVMLLNLEQEERATERRPFQLWLSLLGIVGFAAILFAAVRTSGGAAAESGLPRPTGDVAPLARALFTEAALPFEAVSVLLLAALAGAYVLARREGPDPAAKAREKAR